MTRYDVLFIGGGYATLMAASRLSRAGLRLAVADPRPHFTHRVRLHEVAAGHGAGALPWAHVLPPGVTHLPHRALRVAPGGAELEGLGGVAATQVVLATGSRARVLWSGPGVMPLETAGDAQAIHARVLADPRQRVAVIGAGATGLELAAMLADCHPDLRVSLIDPQGLPGLSPGAREALARRLQRLGVCVVQERVLQVDAEGVHTASGLLPASMVLPCPGFEAPPLARDSGLPVNASGQVLVDDSLQVLGQPGLLAAGDAASLPSQPHVRTSCASALPMGAHVAATALRLRRGEAPRPLRFAWVAQQIALGRHHGLAQGLRWDGEPSWHASGRWVSWTKEGISRAVICLPRWERQLDRSLYAWARPPREAALLEAS
ncbi:MAG: FAD-dependent oxidoreductase [Alphaproteobacteria bacterium]|nr:FAD-dependent oxidoreductase [Alphaproteobacteria bacterium]MCB9796067.1 FAD-dependent oxidoreductase [Alphaproteobacteria bacterium]